MNVPAWQIVGWPVIDLSVDQWDALSDFRILGHSRRQGEDGRLVGSTLWSTEAAGGRVGLAWEWCELQSNVFVMTDPMSIMSNVSLRDKHRVVNEFQRVLQLNNAVYQLPWQKRLVSELRLQDQPEIALPLAA